RARTDDARGWQTGGFPHGIAQQLYWVGRYNKKPIEACLHGRFNDGIHDSDILIHQVQASFAGLLRSACANHDDGCILAVFVSAVNYSRARRRLHHAMVYVHDVSFKLLFINIDDGEMVNGSLVYQCICVGDTNITRADEDNFVSNIWAHTSSLCARF